MPDAFGEPHHAPILGHPVSEYLHYRRANKGAAKVAGKLAYLKRRYDSPESREDDNKRIA